MNLTAGMKSSELLMSALVVLLIVLNSPKLLDFGLDPLSLIGIVTSGASYAISRGVAKMGTPSSSQAADPATPASTSNRRAAR